MVVGVLAALVLAGGCGSAAPPAADEPAIEPPPSPHAHLGGDETVVRQAYERFWQVSQAVPHLPPDRQRLELAAVAAEPLAERMAGALAAQRTRDVTVYGTVTPRISDVRLDGDTAVVRDCQDASRSGQADGSGRPRTVGLARNPVSATVQRSADGAWRVADVAYPGGSC